MKYLLLIILALLSVTLVEGFKMETASYSVESTNTGLAGSNIDSNSYSARFLWEPFYPASNGETSFYWLHPGYFETMTSISQPMTISLISPGNNAYFNGNVSFTYNVTTNGTIASCNLLVTQNTSLIINETDISPLNYSFGSYNLSENIFNWHIACADNLGNVSLSPVYTFTIDRTPPTATIISPLNNATMYNNFTLNIVELNPYELTIRANGTEYVYPYDQGLNVFDPSLPIGYYPYTITISDKAGNNVTYGPYDIYVNSNPIQITHITFEPYPPAANTNTIVKATITGGFSNVTVRVFTNTTGWITYDVNEYIGPAPYKYYYEVDKTTYVAGDQFKQQWRVLDSLGEWQVSGVFNTTVRKSGGAGGSFPDIYSGSNLTIIPAPIQVFNLKGTIFQIKNNNPFDCDLSNVIIKDNEGSKLQDRFNVRTLDTKDLNIKSNKSISLLLKPTGWRGIVGNGQIIVESTNCGTTKANLGVEIYFIDILVDGFNNFTSNIIDFFNNL